MIDLKKLQQLTPRVIGIISVDAGIVWIGDPCYIMHTEDNPPSSIGKDWSEFCDILGNSAHKSFDFSATNNSEGLGVCVSTKNGDGQFNVIGFFEDECNKPSCVIVDFNGVFK